MIEHVHLHRFYSSAVVRLLRLLFFSGLLAILVFSFTLGQYPKLALFIFSCFIMWEIFFHFSLSRFTPQVSVKETGGKNIFSSLTHEALDSFVSATSTEIVGKLLQFPQVRFLLDRAALSQQDIPVESLTQETWLKEAYRLTLAVQGTYITTMDLMAAYLLLLEPKTKLLFSRELKPIDLEAMLIWARMTYPHEELPKEPGVHIVGNGVGEALISGWTPETKNYTTDFTSLALRTGYSIIGREKEYHALINALTKPEMNNVLLIGEVGAGKEKLVEAFAMDSFAGKLPPRVNHKRIITLMVGPLLAGAENRAELEERLQAIVAELSHAGNIILSIPELQEVMGESSYNLNLSGALLPYLKNSNLPIIATMTPGNYKTYMEKNGLREVFSVIELREPDVDVARKMLYKKIPEFERNIDVIIPYRTLKSALLYAPKYLPDDVLPGSAIRLLADAAQNTEGATMLHEQRVVMPEAIIAQVEGKVHAAVAAPEKEEKELLLSLEQKLHERIIGQSEAISVISDALRRLRSGVTQHDRPVSFLFLGPTGVGKTETAKALADLYFGGEEKILRLDMSEYTDEAGVRRLLGAVPGSGDERGELTDKIHDNPYTLVLLDEFEKAHPKILDLFLQILADGRLTDNKGRTVSFSNAIIIATSNAGSEFIREAVQKGIGIDASFQKQLLDYLQTTNLFKPELLNRFDAVVTFEPLSLSQIQDVAKLMLAEVKKRLGAQDITVVFDEKVIALVAKNGYDEEFGARPLRRYIQDTIEDAIAKRELEDSLKRGSTITFAVDGSGNITSQVH